MDYLITDTLLDILTISVTFSVFLMAFIQKFKDLKIVNKGWEIWILNLLFSIVLGVPFANTFYKLDLELSLWVAVFGFIGAPTIYQTLKSQNLIKYKPKSTKDTNTIIISKENEIK